MWFSPLSRVLTLCVLVFLTFSDLAAAEAVRTDDAVVVTASRTERSLDAVPARISVITREDMDRIQAPDLAELLRLQAGIDVSRAGGPGAQTSVFMRGANSNHVLVLIDGVRVAASGTGAFTWETLDPALIERIEIVRGPRAARWGSDAIGGVIQIFTRRPEGVSIEARYGSDADARGVLGLGTRPGDVELDLTVSARRVDGFSAQNPAGFAFDPDDDGLDSVSAASGGAVGLGAGRLSWRTRAAAGTVEFDQGESEFENGSLRMDYAGESAGPWQWRAGAAVLRDRLETSTAFGVNEVITRRVQGDALLERELPSGHWLVGLDGWRESGASLDQWDRSRTNFGLFTGLEQRYGALAIDLAARIDEDETFGTEVTGNAGLQWRPNSNWRWFATAGKGFRAPNFSQLYSPGFGGLFAGNPVLEPERSWSAELGLDVQPLAAHRLTLSLFSNWIEDLIDFSGENFRAVNVNKARIHGLELTHDWQTRDWRSRLGLTWQSPDDLDRDRDLLRRARFKGQWTLGYQWSPRWRTDAEMVHVGSRRDVGQVELERYTLLNLRAGWQIDDRWSVSLRIDNVTDRRYQPLQGFNAPDRRGFVSLGWQR